MNNILHNSGYFAKEVRTVIKTNLASNIFSLLSTGLIFFILSMVLSGWWISSEAVDAIQKEAEVNAYFEEDIEDAAQMVESIRGIAGVREARLVDEKEAYSRMAQILGKEAKVLEYLNDNPFSPFVEVKIDLEKMEHVVESLSNINGIVQIRDNRDALERIRSISEIFGMIGYLVLAAAGITTLVIVSHIIRTGIYENREQINTLRLLGAPEIFIAFPFLLEGLILAIGGGLLATALSAFSINYMYARMAGPLPFIPLPQREALMANLFIVIMLLSAALGVLGSAFGVASARND